MDFRQQLPALSAMSIGERIKSARTKAGISQAELAKMVGRSQSAVAEWETGDTQPRRNIVEKIAAALDVTAVWLEIGGAHDHDRPFEGPGANDAGAGGKRAKEDKLGPVYACRINAEGEHIINKTEIIEHRPKPDRWTKVKGVYGFYVAADTMAPRINPGELVWVHPHLRPTPEQDAVFVRREEEGDEVEALVRVCSGQTATKWVIKQLNPKRETDIKKSEWDSQVIILIDLNR